MPKIEMPTTLEYILQKKKVSELKDIAFRLNIEYPEGKPKASEWVAMVAEAIRTDSQSVQACVDPEALLAMADQLDEMQTPYGYLTEPKESLWDFHFFLELESLGLAILRHGLWHMPIEMADICKVSAKNRKSLIASDRLYRKCDGYLRFFGMMESTALCSKLLPDLENPENFLMHIYTRRAGLNGIVRLDNDKCWLICPDLEDPTRLMHLLENKSLESLPYASYSPETYLLASLDGFALPRNAARSRVEKWLARKTDFPVEDIPLLLHDAVVASQNGHAELYYTIMAEPFDDEIPNMYLDAVRRMQTTIPQWVFKGHSQQDIAEKMEPEKKKVPRGSLCPCGSGKRYRDCCGRAQ